jgi:uncharacterized repeat protein (TIGR03803 family)
MKSRKLTCITAMTLFAALATPTRLAAQEQQEQAPTFTVLHAFTGLSSGRNPTASLVRDNAGNLYGTTSFGGNLACGGNGFGCGLVFKLDTTGKETVLHRFTGGADGSFPPAGLVRDAAGNLYGTTEAGGTHGAGTVFKLGTTGKETVLHSFTGGADGRDPKAGLVRDNGGNLYGTTYTAGDLACGGGFGCGVVFKLDATGRETVLYSFTGGADGTASAAGLLRDAAGNLYGTTYAGGDLGCTPVGGGSGCGVVFKLDTTGTETVLHRFTGGADGADPEAGLVRDSAGNLYGTTLAGGNLACGCGVVFKLDTTGKETILHRFTGGADGRNPGLAGLVRDSAGNLYGTTSAGGNLACGCGVVFKLDTTGKETVLHRFTGGADGAYPEAGLVRDAAGNLYGTASAGGDLACGGGCGVVFKLTP